MWNSNHIPWTIIGIAYVICPLLMLYIRWLLKRENKRRDAEPVDEKYEEVYITIVLPDGTRTERRVDKVRGAVSLMRCNNKLTRRARRNSWI